MTDTSKDNPDRDTNPDPLTGEPGAHPVGTGAGTAGGGLTGAAVGAAIAGPVWVQLLEQSLAVWLERTAAVEWPKPLIPRSKTF